MNKLKVIFNQTIMISSAILLGIGVQVAVYHFINGRSVMEWPWYIPLSIVLTGFLSSLPTCFLLGMDELSREKMIIRTFIHFILVGCVVSLCGFIFNWYEGLLDYLPILIMYVIIYIFVWSATGWLAKSDEKKINDAIKDFQDEE